MSDNKDLIRKQYGAHAEAYVTSVTHSQGPSLARLLELTQPQPNWVVLDVSTGGGHTALAFAPYVSRVIASDLTPEMLAAAERLALERGATNIEFKLADAEHLPFDDGEFDLVTNRIALHHYSDARKAISEMARVLHSPEPREGKLGAILALTDNVVPHDKHTAGYINHFEKLRDPSHNWAYPVVRLEAYFAENGLTVEHSEIFQKEIEFEPWADRMGASEQTKAELRQRMESAPTTAREYWSPRVEGERLYFLLTEAILIGRRA